MNDHSTIEPTDESWVAHLRDLSTSVAPPTAGDPHAMSGVAIRRTRTRRAVLATGGGMLTVAAVAGAALALGGPTTAGGLLPGGAPSASADPSASNAADPDPLAASARSALEVADWPTYELADLTYALPPEIVTSGPVQDEPGVTSDMWHSTEDPDAPPFLRIAYYDEGTASPVWPEIADEAVGEELNLPGVKRAVAIDVSDEAAGLPDGGGPDGRDPDSPTEAAMLVLEPVSGPGAYVLSLNLPKESAKDFVRAFESTLRLP